MNKSHGEQSWANGNQEWLITYVFKKQKYRTLETPHQF